MSTEDNGSVVTGGQPWQQWRWRERSGLELGGGRVTSVGGDQGGGRDTRMDKAGSKRSASRATSSSKSIVKKKLKALTEHAKNSRLGRELVAHVVFLIIFCVVTLVPSDDPNLEALSWSMQSVFLLEDHAQFNQNASFMGPKFVDINVVSDIWSWMKGPFMHAVYMQDWFKGNPWEVGDQNLVAGHNLIAGTVSMRQKRVQRATCTVPQEFLGCLALTSEDV
eukprot:59229-Hanusia_phi.AAC.1